MWLTVYSKSSVEGTALHVKRGRIQHDMLLWLKWDMDSPQVHRRVFIWRSTYKHLCHLTTARRTFPHCDIHSRDGATDGIPANAQLEIMTYADLATVTFKPWSVT